MQPALAIKLDAKLLIFASRTAALGIGGTSLE
jgi:hypothetical protein